MLGAIEAGGTKFIFCVGTGPEDLIVESVPTTSPDATVAAAVGFFRRQKPVEALGIGSFGPVDRSRGWITSTPKAGWSNFDIAGAFRAALDIPVSLDTDVNAAALAEARWGAGRGLTDFIYLTVGTGIGGGAIVNGRLLHGRMHAEMGHQRIPHDSVGDPFPGCCPYHATCLEGLASGPAIQGRWGTQGELLPPHHPAWKLEAHYLALGIANLVCALAPQRIVIGGGVMRQTDLLPLIRTELATLLNRYVDTPEIVPPQLGDRAGALGALILAAQALQP